MDPAHTRRGKVQRMFARGCSKVEIALAMDLQLATVKRYLLRESARESRQPLDRAAVRQYRNQLDGPDQIEDMVQYKDKNGITRWRMPGARERGKYLY